MHKDELSLRLGRLLLGSAIVLALVGAIAIGCGGGGGGDDEPPPFEGPLIAGLFVGETSQGNPISLWADNKNGKLSIDCGGPATKDAFDLTKNKFDFIAAVGADGSFSIVVIDDLQLRSITVAGAFLNQSRAEGSITGDAFCAGEFFLQRCDPAELRCTDKDNDGIADGIDPDHGGRLTPTPTRTVTPTPTKTETPSATARTPTPTAATPAPTPTSTPDAGDLCGNGVIDASDDEDCDGTNLGNATCASLDLGFTGGTLVCDECTFDTDGCTDD